MAGHQRGRRSRYGAWHGGADPLAPPFDVRAAVDQLGEQVLAGESLREALADLLRRGPGRRARARSRRPVRAGPPHAARGAAPGSPRRHGDPRPGPARPGAGRRARGAGRTRRTTTRASPRRGWTPCRARRRGRCRSSPTTTGPAPRRAPTTSGSCSELRDEVLEQRFAGLRDALKGADPAANPEAAQALSHMLSDLEDLLSRHARGEDVDDAFAQFMAQHGDFFPENPQDVDELVDLLARRAAAGERLMRSLTLGAARGAVVADAAGVRRLRPGRAAGRAQRDAAVAASRPAVGPRRADEGRPAARLRRGHRRAGRGRRPRRPARAAGAAAPGRHARRRRRRGGRAPARTSGRRRRPAAAAARARAASAGLAERVVHRSAADAEGVAALGIHGPEPRLQPAGRRRAR